MKNLIIIGARGYGREVFWTSQNCKGYNTEFQVKGYLDDKSDAFEGLWDKYPPIISSVENYEPQENDVFICALGDPKYRKIYSDIILEKGGKFLNLIEKQADIHPSVKMGYGNIISNYSCISPDVAIGNFNIMHRDIIIGHDVAIGSYNFFGSRIFLGGYDRIGDFVSLNPGCTVHPHVTVEDEATVGSNSAVIRKVKRGTTVMGVPAMKLKF